MFFAKIFQKENRLYFDMGGAKLINFLADF